MYGFDSLKAQISLDEHNIECPVKLCKNKVGRQKRDVKKILRYKCPIHNINIFPSTFEYETEYENLLWLDDRDRQYLEQVKTVERGCRMASNNSQDAVSFNVFRYLQKNNLLDIFCSSLCNEKVSNSELIFWSYSEKEKGVYSHLNSAKIEFGEELNMGSEPDIIIQTDKVLFFIKANICFTNETHPSNFEETKKYLTGGNNWFNEVFRNNYTSIAIKHRRYTLLRYWLLGSWIANKLGLRFSLVSLVLGDRELDIEESFGKYIIEDKRRKFKRVNWEDIYRFIITNKIDSTDYSIIVDYYNQKCLGYNSNQTLVKAFSV